MDGREKLVKWLRDGRADELEEVREFGVKSELEKFDKLTSGMGEAEKLEFANDWIRNEKIEAEIASFAGRASVLKPSQKSEAKVIQKEFQDYIENLRQKDPKAYARHERMVDLTGTVIASVVQTGRSGVLR